MTRDRLIRLIQVPTRPGLSAAAAIALMSSPFLIALTCDIGGLLAGGPHPRLRFPWQRESLPSGRLLDVDLEFRGDLLRMADLPRYDRVFADRPTHRQHILTDESGHLNPPSGLPDPFRTLERDITVIGASFMASGSSNDETFSGRLAQVTGLRVYNAAWPGRSGALHAAEVLLDEDLIGKTGETILLMSIVQRALDADLSGFHDLRTRLAETGEYRQLSAWSAARRLAKDYLRWNQRLDEYLLETSVVRKWAAAHSGGFPPMSFNMGLDSAVELAYLAAPYEAPILFLKSTIASRSSSFADRNGSYICETLRRLDAHCDGRGVRFVLLLIPDKFEVYHDHLRPVSSRSLGASAVVETPVTTVFAQRLEEVGVEAIDLLPQMLEAQFESDGSLLFELDDTHWSNHGVQVAAQYVAEVLGFEH